MQPSRTPGPCKALPCRPAPGHPFCRPALWARPWDRGTLKPHSPGWGTGIVKESWSLASWQWQQDLREPEVCGCLLCSIPTTFHEMRGMEAVGLETQLCFESVLIGLVYWLKLNNFP